MKFQNENSLPPLPTLPKSDDKIIDVLIDSKSDFTFEQQSDTTSYRYNFSSQLDIRKYLELTEKLNNNAQKIKLLTTLYPMKSPSPVL